MSGTGAPPPAVGENEVRPVPVESQPSSTSLSAGTQQEPLPLVEAGDEVPPGPVSSSVAVDFISVVGEEHLQPVPPQSSPESGIQQELLPLSVAGDDGSADSVDTEVMSISASAARSRPFSLQAGSMCTPHPKSQFKLQPFVKAGETEGQEPVSSSGDLQSFGLPWVKKDWRKKSPQPSTSKAPVTAPPQEWQPYIEPGEVADQMYARDLSMRYNMRFWNDASGEAPIDDESNPYNPYYGRRTPVGFWDPVNPATLPPAGLQLETQPFVATDDERSTEITDSDILIDTQNISTPWESMRPWSPQTTTASAAMMLQLELLPGNTEVTSTDSIEAGPSQTISDPLGEEQLRSWSPSPRKRSEDMREMSTIDYSDYSMPERDSSSPIQKKLRRWPPQELTTPAQRALLEMRSAFQQAEAEENPRPSPVSDLSCGAQNLSVGKGKGKGKKRPCPPPAPHIQPLMEAIDTRADAFSMSVVQNISALVEENRRRVSPQPSTAPPPTQVPMAVDETPDAVASTSAAQDISGPVREEVAPEPPEPSAAATVEVEVPPPTVPDENNPEDSVYAHVPHNISNIPQLRGLKAGRRHGRLRRLNAQNKMNEKYGPMMDYLGPMVAEESAKQQTQQILIASALDHFANTITQIADNYEGKIDTTGFTERLEDFKKRMEDRAEKRRKRNPTATEESLPRPPSPPKLSEEEINRRLREETEAAVEALLTGDRSKENPNRFAEIIKSFQAAFKPPSK